MGMAARKRDPDRVLAEHIAQKAEWLARGATDPESSERERNKHQRRMLEGWAALMGIHTLTDRSRLVRELVRLSGEDLYWGLDDPGDEDVRALRRREAVRVCIRHLVHALPEFRSRLAKHRDLVECAVLACEHTKAKGGRMKGSCGPAYHGQPAPKRKRDALKDLLKALKLPASPKVFRSK